MPLSSAFHSVDSIRATTGQLWLILVAVWLLGAFAAKPTLQRQSSKSRFWYAAIIGLGLFLIFRKNVGIGWLDTPLLPVTVGVAVLGFVLTCLGVAFSIWARLTLGGNWSASVTITLDHALVCRGPYRIVRHPIYTGLLIALLGSALQYGYVRSLLGVLLVGFGFWLKSLMEEQFMAQRFGDAYLTYRQHVRALVPFIF